ncbi:MAG: BCCT family transporter [Clostridia bacterium]|jgi:glycine betaine transporter|nr:BCCT family transporter [Clostridia bacterium]
MFGETVFVLSLVLVLPLIIMGIYSPSLLDELSSAVYATIISHFGWLYLLAVFSFLLFCIALAFSRFGNIKLGRDDEKPDYNYFSWFSMLFAAGLAIGLVFFGVGEPLSHYSNPPGQIAAYTGEAAVYAMRYSFFHWGLNGWAVYAIMSLSIAYFTFRRGMKPLISSCFYPLMGDRIYGLPGKIIDVLAVVATLFGVVTSLGLGAIQINSGLVHILGWPDDTLSSLVIIAIVTALFLISSSLGLDSGIQVLSKLNVLIAMLLLALVFILGPASYILNVFTSTLGGYLHGLLAMSLDVNPFTGYEWTRDWTLFYWAWWISWAPFVGIFVARISRGRTIKEFILGILLVPTLITFIWFSVFGGAALHLQQIGGVDVAQVAVNDISRCLFIVFEYYPLGGFLSALTIILLIVFFTTSADSATFVLGMLTSDGHLSPPLSKKITWGLMEGGFAVVLLLSGGLDALRRMTVNVALPFTIVMILMCWNLYKALREEGKDFSLPPH